MSTASIPSTVDKEVALARLEAHAQRHYIGKGGVVEIRGHFKQAYFFLNAVKEEKTGLAQKLLLKDTVRGVGRIARLEYLGRDRWKFLIYKPHLKKYGPFKDLEKGTIEECLDAAASVYITPENTRP